MMSVNAASAVRMEYGAVAKGYSWLLDSINRSTTNKGMEKRQSMKNAEAYSVRQAQAKDIECQDSLCPKGEDARRILSQGCIFLVRFGREKVTFRSQNSAM